MNVFRCIIIDIVIAILLSTLSCYQPYLDTVNTSKCIEPTLSFQRVSIFELSDQLTLVIWCFLGDEQLSIYIPSLKLT